MPIHIEAKKEDIAPVVLLVGNPQRAEYIAENYLEKVNCYNSYRLMYGYTGEYKGKRISVQTSGMGSPSLSIILEELVMLEAKTFIRMGTCGAVKEGIKHSDLILVTGSHSSHDIFSQVFPGASFSACPDFQLTKLLSTTLDTMNLTTHTGPVLCSEIFYEDSMDTYKKFASYNTLAVEMETYLLFALAAKHHLKAACLLTVSDLIFENARADKELIKKGVDAMTRSVLDTICTNYDYTAR